LFIGKLTLEWEDRMSLDDKKITVCNKCLRASCWHGFFHCEDYKTAGTIEKTIGELKKLNLEDSHYWLLKL
jgi:hypothetical protein